jgi:hypothetical protein
MSLVTIPTHVPARAIYLYNGAPARAGYLPQYANSLWSKRVLIAAQAWSRTNAPTILGNTWASATSSTWASTAKLRADLPIMLQGKCAYDGAAAEDTCRATARIVIWNSSVAASILTGFRVYQGDPATATTYWALESSADYTIPAGAVREICLSGVISPLYKHGSKITNTDLNCVFIDAKAVKSGTSPKLLFFGLYLDPVPQLVDTGTVLPRTNILDPIGATEVEAYLEKLQDVNEEYALTTPGTLCMIDQSATGNGNLGYTANLYYYARTYHMFDVSTYDDTTVVKGSYWVPLAGKGVYCSDGKWRYLLEMLVQQQASADITITYAPVWFPPDSNVGTAFSTAGQALVSGVSTQVRKVFTLESATEITDGIAFCPRVKKSGTSDTNLYLYSALFGVRALTYTQL